MSCPKNGDRPNSPLSAIGSMVLGRHKTRNTVFLVFVDADGIHVARVALNGWATFLNFSDRRTRLPSNSKIFTPGLEESSYVAMRGRLREDRQMLLYVQTWLPLLTFTLTAAIFFGVVSFILVHAKA